MNNLPNMKLRNIFILLAVFVVTIAKAQEQEQNLLLENAKQYEIAGIEVTGAKRYNSQNILTTSGLKIGDVISIPSEKFSSIIQKLWSYKLFSDVDIYITKTEGDKVYLELAITETPSLTEVVITGVKPKHATEIIEKAELKKGITKVNESLIAKTKNYVANKYKKEGFLNAKVHIATKVDTTDVNGVKMLIQVDKGDKVKISQIAFEGNQQFSDSKLRSQFKKTKQRLFGRVWKRSKFIQADYENDLTSLLNFYKEKGYRDARIVKDIIVKGNGNDIALNISVEEGKKYYFGDIKFLGNSVYNNQVLQRILGLNKGDIYNGVQLKKRINDPEKPDGDNISNLYQNNGYLFSQITPVEVSVLNDTINFEVRIHEGKQAYLNNVIAKGNTLTNDKVIYREMRTRPGYLYSKDDIMRTMREISQLGFFDAEKVRPEIKNPDPNSGTVDIEWNVDDTNNSSQIQLQGGYGGGSFIGSVGLSFNNFSIQNLFDKKSYRPLPMGDGQKLSLNAQVSRAYHAYSFSFMEPWMGGEKPVQFSVSFQHMVQYSQNYFGNFDVDRSKRFLISGVTVGLAKRLSFPDDYFQLSQNIGFNHYNLQNYNTGLFTFGDGYSNSLAYTVSLSRRSSGPNPIFPMGGSDFSLTAKLTLPYSLMNGVNYKGLLEKRAEAVKEGNTREISNIDQQRFKWLEFYKLKGTAVWYTNLIDKLVLKSAAEFGYLGAYNSDRGLVPFERFFVGGDGMGYYQLDGRENISMRGYPNQALSSQDGDVVYNKFSLELRYPITLKPTASIYGLAFVEGANSFDNYKKYNPFDLKRAAGVGVRIFMPMFGMLGFDFGYGFDGINGIKRPNGWETHFIFGQQF